MPSEPVDSSSDALEIAPAPAGLGGATARGGAISVVAQTIIAAFQFAAMVALARLLAPEDFGLIAMAATATGIVTMFSELGLSTAAIQIDKLDNNLASAFFRLNAALGILVAALLAASGPLVAQLFDEPRLVDVMVLMSGPIVISALVRQHGAILQRQMKWLKLAAIALVSTGAGSAVAVLSAWLLDWGYWSLIAQSYAAAATAAVLTLAMCRWMPGKVTDWSRVREPLAFGLHLTAFTFVNYFHRQLDDVLVGWRWGAGPLGQYNRAYALLLLPITIVGVPLSRTALSALSRCRADAGQWQSIYLTYVFIMTFVTSLVGIYFFVFSDQIVRFLFGPGWESAARVLQFLAISMPAAGAMHTTGTVYSSVGDAKGLNVWALFSTPIIVASFVVGLPFGPEYMAGSYSIAVTALMVPCLLRAINKAPISPRPVFEVIFAPLVASFVLAGIGRHLTEAGGLVVDRLVFVALVPAYCGLVALGLLSTERGRTIVRLAIGHAGNVFATLSSNKR